MGNFIDKTFTVIADILLKVLPTTKREKEAFSYYRDGMSAQAEGEYAEALQNYYEAMRLEIDPYDRSYILYNIGLIHTSNGEHAKALEYYYQALERNPSLPQALNNIAVIYHYRGEQAIEAGNPQISQVLFDKAADYWKEAIRLALVALDSNDAPAGKMPVILGSGWPGVLLHEAIGHGLEGDFNRKGTSVFSGKIGEKWGKGAKLLSP